MLPHFEDDRPSQNLPWEFVQALAIDDGPQSKRRERREPNVLMLDDARNLAALPMSRVNNLAQQTARIAQVRVLHIVEQECGLRILPDVVVQWGRVWSDRVPGIVRQLSDATETRRFPEAGAAAPNQPPRRVKKLMEDVTMKNPCRIENEVLERHHEPNPVKNAEHNLERVLNSLAPNDTRAWVKDLILSDESNLSVAEIELLLELPQSHNGIGLLTTRRAMGVAPHGGDAGPEFVRRPHGSPPNTRALGHSAAESTIWLGTIRTQPGHKEDQPRARQIVC